MKTKSASKTATKSEPHDLRTGIWHRYCIAMTEGVVPSGPVKCPSSAYVPFAGAGGALKAFSYVRTVEIISEYVARVVALRRILEAGESDCPRSIRMEE